MPQEVTVDRVDGCCGARGAWRRDRWVYGCVPHDAEAVMANGDIRAAQQCVGTYARFRVR